MTAGAYSNPPRGNAADAMPPCDLLIRHASVATMDAEGRHIDDGAIAIADGRITAIGPDAELAATPAGRVVDARGALVHPGLVEPHCHVTLHTSRGALPEAPANVPGTSARASFGGFSRWINALDDRDEHAAALLACTEMALAGVTSFMDPGTAFAPDAVAEAAAAVGIRGSVADPFLWDVRGGLTMASEIPRAPADTKRALAALGGQLWRNADEDALVRGHVAIYGAASASDELQVAASALARSASCTLTQHQSFDQAEVDFDRARHGGREPIAHLAALDALGEHCAFMHMNALTEAEREIVAERRVAVIWHPGNVLYYGLGGPGRSPMLDLRDRGVPVTVATDLAKSWTFGEMGWLAYLLARAGGDRLDPADVLGLQTRAAARAVGRADDLGSIEVGKRADLVIHDRLRPESAPAVDQLRHATLIARGASVGTVIVAGRPVVEDGRPVNVDLDAVVAGARDSALGVLRRVEAA